MYNYLPITNVVYVYTCVGTYAMVHTEARGQLCGVRFLHPTLHGCQGLNSDCQTCTVEICQQSPKGMVEKFNFLKILQNQW